jgi:DNA-binding winged helix-turn-helix (wHTH) protein
MRPARPARPMPLPILRRALGATVPPDRLVLVPSKRLAVRDRARTQLPPMHWQALEILACRPGYVGREELIDAIWGCDPEGGPDDGTKALYKLVYGLNRQLSPLGLHAGFFFRGVVLEDLRP